MIVDPAVLPGLLLLAAEFAVLAAVGYVVVRVALREDNELSAMAQGLVVGPGLWGIVVNFIMYAIPGLAGAAAGWAVMLGLAAALAWRWPGRLRPPVRPVAGIASAFAALGIVGLASRQLLGVPDLHTSLGLAATIRAGGFPVSLPWHVDAPSSYHYGASLLAGLLAPPVGPDLVFVWELLGVYAWVSLAVVVITALRHRGSWLTALLLAPLLLSYGLHTSVSRIEALLRIPIPTGLPAAGLGNTFAYTYWGPVEPVGSRLGSLPDVWNPSFTLGYALAFVVLAQAARTEHATWRGYLTLAGLVGFLGLLVTTLAPVVMLIWIGLEAVRLIRARRAGASLLAPALRSGAGLVAAGLILRFGGGALSEVADGGARAGLTLASNLDAMQRPVVGVFNAHPGGLGILSVGPLAVAGIAIALARRDWLVTALAGGAVVLALAWLSLDYPPFAQDLRRLGGHARNLAMLALLLALSAHLARLPSRRWRYATAALLVVLIVWPTAVGPARAAAGALGQGVQLANAGPGWRAAREQDETAMLRRFLMPRMSRRLAADIRSHVPVDAPVLDPSADLAVLLHTGRPNNFGFANAIHLIWRLSPEYLDARHFLEPATFRRLGLAYIYATEAWVAGLPPRSQHWLSDPRLFDLLARDGDESLYRVRPAFLSLQSAPHPDSFEALRDISPGTLVYLQPQVSRELQERLLRMASVLSHTRLVGGVNPERLHLLTPAPWKVEPLGTRVPALVAMPLLHEAWVYPPAGWREVWRNPPTGVALYAPPAAGEGMATVEPSPVHVRMTDLHAEGERVTFTATLEASAKEPWLGQDWVLGPVDASPWGIPVLQRDGQLNVEQWFAGQAAGGATTTTHRYVFDSRASSLAVRGTDGAYTTVQASNRAPSPGAWMLALRLTHPSDRGFQEFVLIVPVLRFDASDDGTVSSVQVYEAVRGWRSP